ncbi:flavin reductase family protein [Joostella sp. CR20]|uniref:flavin reductase family protein n=1 Tax=Joostella sp. CR20 TaxID=2804312 RepID=UPI00313AABD9
MLSIDPKEISTAQLHGYLLGAVSPRPIAFASTIDASGAVNLSPFSFFNVYSSNPPIMIFSANRRVRDNTTKHTLQNVLETKEVVVNVVNYNIVQQTSLSSTEYEKGVNEFEKAGLTMLKSDVVKPFRVAESPVQFECKVNEVISLGEQGGAGNLIVCEVVKLHVNEAVLDENGQIDQYKIDLVSRMGGNWYSRANAGMFEVPKPLSSIGIGVDAIPENIRYSKVLTGNDLGILGNVESLPTATAVTDFQNTASEEIKAIIKSANEEAKHKKAQQLIAQNDVTTAWLLLMTR